MAKAIKWYGECYSYGGADGQQIIKEFGPYDTEAAAIAAMDQHRVEMGWEWENPDEDTKVKGLDVMYTISENVPVSVAAGRN